MLDVYGREQKDPQERREKLQNRLEKMQKLRVDSVNAKDSPERIITLAIAKDNPSLSNEDTRKLAREVVLAPKGAKLKMGKEEFNVEDLQYRVANSIEIINCETSTGEEYFRWIGEGHDIIRKMNDGFVEESELNERNDFLGSLDQREAELMTCLGLYQSSATPLAQQKYAELSQKLTKLREIRSAIYASTKNEADKKNTREEYEKALVYYHAVKDLVALSEEDKRRLGLEQDVSKERFGGWLVEKVANDKHSPAERLLMQNQSEQTKEDLAKRIEILRGRKSMDELLEEQAKSREEIRKRAFSKEQFAVLATNSNVRENEL